MDDLKLIRHTGSTDIPDDLTYPWRLDASFRPTSFMTTAFTCLIGKEEEIRVRGLTKEILDEFTEKNDLRDHPRLISIEITQPEGC